MLAESKREATERKWKREMGVREKERKEREGGGEDDGLASPQHSHTHRSAY